VTCCLGVTLGAARGGVACLYMLFFFESICYPVRARKPHDVRASPNVGVNHVALQCIFTLSTRGLGPHTKRGSGLIVMVRDARPRRILLSHTGC
jgi:FHS family L-fucose permease-like MFS transporter